MNREPSWDIGEPRALLLGQLAHLRSATLDKLAGLTEDQLRSRVLPSAWTPLELLNHLIHMERRWMQWGFEGRQIADPLGDTDENDHWQLADREGRPPQELLADLAAMLDEISRRTDQIAAEAELETRAKPGGRFRDREPTLGWILLHMLQEYARHLGHLDAVRELLDGEVGE
jgi:uncharacterized damage-inducible protein DinB